MTEDAVHFSVGGALVLKAPSHADGAIQQEARLRAPLLNQVTNGAPESYPGPQVFQRLNRLARMALGDARCGTDDGNGSTAAADSDNFSGLHSIQQVGEMRLRLVGPHFGHGHPPIRLRPVLTSLHDGGRASHGSGPLHEAGETGAARRHGDAPWAVRRNGDIDLAAGMNGCMASRRLSLRVKMDALRHLRASRLDGLAWGMRETAAATMLGPLATLSHSRLVSFLHYVQPVL